jgi:hypothetical protein
MERSALRCLTASPTLLVSQQGTAAWTGSARQVEAWCTGGVRGSDGAAITSSGVFLKGGLVHSTSGQRLLSPLLKRCQCVSALRSHASIGLGEPLSTHSEALECSGPRRIRGFETVPQYSRLVFGSSAELRFPLTANVAGCCFVDALLGVGFVAEAPGVLQRASTGVSVAASIFRTDLTVNSAGELRVAAGLRDGGPGLS